jgi:hypothetical protein
LSSAGVRVNAPTPDAVERSFQRTCRDATPEHLRSGRVAANPPAAGARASLAPAAPTLRSTVEQVRRGLSGDRPRANTTNSSWRCRSSAASIAAASRRRCGRERRVLYARVGAVKSAVPGLAPAERANFAASARLYRPRGTASTRFRAGQVQARKNSVPRGSGTLFLSPLPSDGAEPM